MHHRTVRLALASATPPPRKAPVRTARVLEPFKPAIDQPLRSDLDAPHKQRHTARRVPAVPVHGRRHERRGGRLMSTRRQPTEPAVLAAIEAGCRTLRLPNPVAAASVRSPPPPNASS